MEKRTLSGDEMLKDTLDMYKKLVNRQLLLMKTITELRAKTDHQAKHINTLETTIKDRLNQATKS